MLSVAEDVEIARSLDPLRMTMPSDDYLDEGCWSGNRDYVDLRGVTWTEAEEALAAEAEMVDAIASLEGRYDAYEEIEDDLMLLKTEYLHGMDLGVGSSALCLAAAGCLPYASCNGGCLGEQHQEEHPLVVFYAHHEWASTLLSAAEAANVGLDNDQDSSMMVYSSDIRQMIAFARELLSRKNHLDDLKVSIGIDWSNRSPHFSDDDLDVDGE